MFDVVLNMNSIISDLDIYEKVGHGVAYDEIVPFQISSGMKTLTFNGVESEVRGGKIRVEFIKVCLSIYLPLNFAQHFKLNNIIT